MTAIDVIIQIAASFLGTLGFGILFNIRDKKLCWTAIGGMMAWSLFLFLGLFIQNEAVRYFIVSVCGAVYAEIMARMLKTPASTFSVTILIPLIPGSALYYTTTHALAGACESFAEKAIYTLELSVALALGLVLVTATARYLSIHKQRKFEINSKK